MSVFSEFSSDKLCTAEHVAPLVIAAELHITAVLLEKLEEGYECVWGSRFMKGGSMREQPLYRRILSGGGTLLSNLVLGTRLKDMTSGFEAFQREILEKMNFEKFLSTGHMYQTEMRYYCRNCRTVEVPIHYVGTASSLKGSSVVEALKILFKLKKNERNIWKK